MAIAKITATLFALFPMPIYDGAGYVSGVIADRLACSRTCSGGLSQIASENEFTETDDTLRHDGRLEMNPL